MTFCSLAKCKNIHFNGLNEFNTGISMIKIRKSFRCNFDISKCSKNDGNDFLIEENGNSIRRRTYNDTRHRSNVCCQLHVRIPKRVHQSCVQICFIFRRSGIFLFMYKSSSVEVVLLRIVTPSMSFCCLLCCRSFLQVTEFGVSINA